MRILVLNGSPRPKGNTKRMVEAFQKGAESVGHQVDVVDVCRKKIAGCLACEYCHTKGNGVCVQKDDMQEVYSLLMVADMLPEDAPFFVADYHDYYKTNRGYHKRSLNSNGGWNVIGCMSFMNQPILQYSNEIRSAVLIMHGEKAHSCYFSRDAYTAMVKDNPYADNKELLIIPDAVHTDLYDGGGKDAIPFDKLEQFFEENLK